MVGSPEKQAEYLKYFRSDSIVKDAEFIRKALVPNTVQNGRWSILGQSFGGFCCTQYLSSAPEGRFWKDFEVFMIEFVGLNEVFMTGGIPPDIASLNAATDVYQRTFRRVIQQNKKYYMRFPGKQRHKSLFARGLKGT